MSIDAFILPYSVIKNFWWSLPLLSAALGAVLGQMCPGARTLAVRGAPVCLLLAVSGALIWRDDFLFIGAVYGLNHILSGALLLIAAALAAGGAVLCAFRPTRAGCGAAALGATLWLAFTANGLFQKYLTLYGKLFVGMLIPTVIGVLAAVLAFMGAFGKEAAPTAAPTPQQEPPVAPQPTVSAGCLTILCGSFSGQQLPLPAGEELTLGGDAAQCHLILDQPGVSPCLCSICWLEGRNTYLVSCHAPEGLLWADGSCAPSGSTTEVFPGTVCYLPVTGSPVVQLG